MSVACEQAPAGRAAGGGNGSSILSLISSVSPLSLRAILHYKQPVHRLLYQWIIN